MLFPGAYIPKAFPFTTFVHTQGAQGTLFTCTEFKFSKGPVPVHQKPPVISSSFQDSIPQILEVVEQAHKMMHWHNGTICQVIGDSTINLKSTT